LAKIGVLALQGDFEKHGQVISRLGHVPVFVKTEEALKQADRLIIPGGESTTFLKLIDRLDLREALLNYCKSRPVFGTCAGLIILSTDVVNAPFNPLKLIDLKVQRNAYGRQIDSFIDDIKISLNSDTESFEAVFIRAPKILECLADTKPIAYHNDDIVMACQNNILVATFHPELTRDERIHNFFIKNFG
jgi:pyridoxal 5'-phosphate synthase pdxT subunit